MQPLRLILLLGLALLAGTRLRAHNAPGSAVLLDFRSDSIGAELRLPISELQHGFHQNLEADPATVAPRFRSALADYVRQHLAVRTPDGQAWTIEVSGMEVALTEEPIDLVVQTAWHPPAGAPLRQFTLNYDVISHEVVNHIVLVSVRSDWARAQLGDQPEALGALRSFASQLTVDREAGSTWRGFRSVLMLGVHHIAEGTDHLMFLLALLLPAPLFCAGAGRWGGYGGLRHSGVRLTKIVTAFTLGHSVTLIVATFGWVHLPGRPVEVLIAVSILVSAAHAVRPIFAGREPLIAAGFGLVHGLAFAETLTVLHLDAWQLAQALLAFNVGIELMQLLVVAVTIPSLVLLSRTRVYPVLRIGGAALAGAAALGWIGERAGGWANPFLPIVDGLAAHALALVGLLTVLAATASLWSRRATPSAAIESPASS